MAQKRQVIENWWSPVYIIINASNKFYVLQVEAKVSFFIILLESQIDSSVET